MGDDMQYGGGPCGPAVEVSLTSDDVDDLGAFLADETFGDIVSPERMAEYIRQWDRDHSRRHEG